jgi:competence protein ComEA
MIKSISLCLAALIALLMASSGCSPARPIEVHPFPTSAPAMAPNVYIGGDVEVPGIFDLKPDDTLEDLLQSTGGISNGGECRSSYVYFFQEQPDYEQKVNINRAPAWLLQALPGVGEVTANKIINYRRQHGQFRQVKEIMYVDGIGEATFAQLADKISVAPYPERPD